MKRLSAPAAASARTAGRDAGLAVRQIALEILLEVEYRRGYADALLGTRIRALSPADRRLATRLVLGTLAWRARLDYEIERLAERALKSIQPEALEILRMGLFQMRKLNRVPIHAVVSTGVELAKRSSGSKSAAGFVNAVMRRAARDEIDISKSDLYEADYLAIAYSHPRWLVERFIESYGREGAARLMAANNEAAPNAIRINLARATRADIIERLVNEGFQIGAFGRAPETLVLKSAPRFDSDAHRDGLFVAQSEASQLIARMLSPAPGATVIDLACAPGGKSTHLAELVTERGRVLGMDVNLRGIRNARALAHRLRHRKIEFACADAAGAIPLAERSCDFVLLDAPCTGLGTLREHPEIKWRLSPDDPARMGLLQSRMLANAAAIVRDRGAIVYSVCSIAREEGEEVIGRFLDANRDFEIDRQFDNASEMSDLIAPDGFLRTRPDLDGLDGFFAARLVRKTRV